jgi:hypothetical protein
MHPFILPSRTTSKHYCWCALTYGGKRRCALASISCRHSHGFAVGSRGCLRVLLTCLGVGNAAHWWFTYGGLVERALCTGCRVSQRGLWTLERVWYSSKSPRQHPNTLCVPVCALTHDCSSGCCRVGGGVHLGAVLAYVLMCGWRLRLLQAGQDAEGGRALYVHRPFCARHTSWCVTGVLPAIHSPAWHFRQASGCWDRVRGWVEGGRGQGGLLWHSLRIWLMQAAPPAYSRCARAALLVHTEMEGSCSSCAHACTCRGYTRPHVAGPCSAGQCVGHSLPPGARAV